LSVKALQLWVLFVYLPQLADETRLMLVNLVLLQVLWLSCLR